MTPKFLLCDIGNTSIKVGFATEDGIFGTYALPVNREATVDSLGLTLLELCRHAKVETDAFAGGLACSVVPGLDPLLRDAARRYLGVTLRFAPQDVSIPLENRYERPGEVGADRLVGAFAARRQHPGAAGLIVVDYGTAATFDCVSGDAYLGGLIFPGPATAVAGLARQTAKLPEVNLEVECVAPTPGRNTATSMRHGLVFGYVAVTEGLCGRLRSQLPEPVKIVATGGFAQTIAKISHVFDAVSPTLLLDGLRLLQREN